MFEHRKCLAALVFVYFEDTTCCSGALSHTAEKHAYIICNQFIEQQFRGKALRRSCLLLVRGQRRCQYWSTVTLTDHECSHWGVGNPTSKLLIKVLSDSFNHSFEWVKRKEENLREYLLGKMQMAVTHWEKSSVCNSRSTCFFSLSPCRYTRRSRSKRWASRSTAYQWLLLSTLGPTD